MGQPQVTAVAALGQVLWLEGIVRPPPVPATLGRFLLWEWCHFKLLSFFQ
jgi:hypothetical protein